MEPRGWILSTRYKDTDLDSIKDFAAYPELRWLEKHNWIGPWSLAIASFVLFGWGGLLIGFFLSTVLLWHGTFLVNSMAHIMGRRRYATPDTSRNSFLIAIVTGGEGWHNNHHYLPASVRQGFRWWEYDPTWYVLKGLAALHVVKDLKNPPARLLDQARVRDGAFDIGMFRSYWERAAKVTGERIADLSARPMAPSAEGADPRPRPSPFPDRPRTGSDEALSAAGRTDLPGTGVRRPARRLHQATEGDQGGIGRGRHRRSRPGMSPASAASAGASVWIVDLDGVLWLAGEPIGDAAGAVAALRGTGARVVFATNNSSPTTAQLMARLERIGVSAGSEDLITSANVVASLLEPGERVHLLAEGGTVEALERRGVEIVDEGVPDAAVVGWSRAFDFAALTAVSTAARESGRLLATNADPTHPTPEGLMPGSGALLAAVATASGVVPVVAGKPNTPMVEYVRRHVLAAGESAVMVGDQPGTDGVLAERLGIPFALVDSGVTAPGAVVDTCPVAIRVPDLVTLVATALG